MSKRSDTHFRCGHKRTESNTYYAPSMERGRCWKCKNAQAYRYVVLKRQKAERSVLFIEVIA